MRLRGQVATLRGRVESADAEAERLARTLAEAEERRAERGGPLRGAAARGRRHGARTGTGPGERPGPRRGRRRRPRAGARRAHRGRRRPARDRAARARRRARAGRPARPPRRPGLDDRPGRRHGRGAGDRRRRARPAVVDAPGRARPRARAGRGARPGRRRRRHGDAWTARPRPSRASTTATAAGWRSSCRRRRPHAGDRPLPGLGELDGVRDTEGARPAADLVLGATAVAAWARHRLARTVVVDDLARGRALLGRLTPTRPPPSSSSRCSATC